MVAALVESGALPPARPPPCHVLLDSKERPTDGANRAPIGQAPGPTRVSRSGRAASSGWCSRGRSGCCSSRSTRCVGTGPIAIRTYRKCRWLLLTFHPTALHHRRLLSHGDGGTGGLCG
jgi:hypothetical protein